MCKCTLYNVHVVICIIVLFITIFSRTENSPSLCRGYLPNAINSVFNRHGNGIYRTEVPEFVSIVFICPRQVVDKVARNSVVMSVV